MSSAQKLPVVFEASDYTATLSVVIAGTSTPFAIPGTIQVDFYRFAETSPFISSTLANGRLASVNASGGQIVFDIPAADLANIGPALGTVTVRRIDIPQVLFSYNARFADANEALTSDFSTNFIIRMNDVTLNVSPSSIEVYADHVHPNATTSVAGFMSASDKTIVDGVTAGLAGKADTSHTHVLSSGATDVTITAANLNALDDFADTTLHFHASDRARANHTGTQGIATVTGLQTALDAKLDDSQASAFGLSLLDDGDAATAQATLGLGSAALQASGAFATASHSHPQSDVTNLVSDLAGKANLAGGNTFTGANNFDGALVNTVFTASTNSVQDIGFETLISTGSVAAGFGIRNTKWMENSSGSGTFAAAIDYVWVDATAGSEDSRISFMNEVAGAAGYSFHIEKGVWTHTATGGDMGPGTINVTGYYLNGVDALASKANLASPTFTGTPTAPTPALADDSTKIATTEYVTDKIAAATAGVSQVVGYSGNVTLANLLAGGVAPSDSPTFTGPVYINNGSGSEGGEIVLAKPASGTSIVSTVSVDVAADFLRVFDNGAPNRGAKLHLPSLLSGVNSNLLVDDMMGRTFASLYGLSASASAATNTTALNAAIAAGIASGRRRITLPSGAFQINNLDTITSAHDLVIEGAGEVDGGYSGGTILAVQTATGEVVRINASQHPAIKGIYFRHDVRRTADYTVVFGAGCFHPHFDGRIDYAFNGVRVFGTSEADINLTCRYLYGTRGILVDGDTSNRTYGINIKIEADNPYPISNNGTRKTYSNGLAVTAGEILWCPTGGTLYQVTTTGSLGATEPDTIGGTTGQDGFTTTITSGTAQLTFVARSLRWIVNENYAYSVRVRKGSYMLNGYMGVSIEDTANSADSRPKWFYMEGETDHTYSHGVYGERGESLYCEGAWLGSSLAGAGLYVPTTWAGDVSTDPSCRFAGNWLQGAFFGATNNVRMIGSLVEFNSQSASGASDGVYFGGTIEFTASGIRSRGGNQRYGIAVDTGGDYFVIKDNILRTNVNSGVLNVPGTSANRRIVSDNVV